MKCDKDFNPFPGTGVGWIGCDLDRDHEGPHKITLDAVSVYNGRNVYPAIKVEMTWDAER